MKNQKTLNEVLITKRFVNMVNRFNNDLNAFAESCGEEVPTLYEDICTPIEVSNVRIEGDYMVYQYNGREEKDLLFRFCDNVTKEEEAAAIEKGMYYNWIEEAKEKSRSA